MRSPVTLFLFIAMRATHNAFLSRGCAPHHSWCAVRCDAAYAHILFVHWHCARARVIKTGVHKRTPSASAAATESQTATAAAAAAATAAAAARPTSSSRGSSGVGPCARLSAYFSSDAIYMRRNACASRPRVRGYVCTLHDAAHANVYNLSRICAYAQYARLPTAQHAHV